MTDFAAWSDLPARQSNRLSSTRSRPSASGTRPSPGAKVAPTFRASPVLIAAAMPVEISGPIPGTLISRRHIASPRLSSSISLVQMAPVLVKAEDQLGRSWRYLVLSVLQYREERVAKGTRISPDGDALLDKKGSDLVDRRCSGRLIGTGRDDRPAGRAGPGSSLGPCAGSVATPPRRLPRHRCSRSSVPLNGLT